MAIRILVINDTQDILDSFRDLLEGEGYEVFLYSYAPRELDDVRRVRPDLIILDLIFGQEKSGFQFLQIVKMHRDTATIPVVLCTAATREVREIEGYLKAQNVALVPKPFDIDMLLDTIKTTLASQPNVVPQGDDGEGEADGEGGDGGDGGDGGGEKPKCD